MYFIAKYDMKLLTISLLVALPLVLHKHIIRREVLLAANATAKYVTTDFVLEAQVVDAALLRQVGLLTHLALVLKTYKSMQRP